MQQGATAISRNKRRTYRFCSTPPLAPGRWCRSFCRRVPFSLSVLVAACSHPFFLFAAVLLLSTAACHPFFVFAAVLLLSTAACHRLLSLLVLVTFTAWVCSRLSLISYHRRRSVLLAVTAYFHSLAPLVLFAAATCC